MRYIPIIMTIIFILSIIILAKNCKSSLESMAAVYDQCDEEAEKMAEEACYKNFSNHEFKISKDYILFCNNNGKSEETFWTYDRDKCIREKHDESER